MILTFDATNKRDADVWDANSNSNIDAGEKPGPSPRYSVGIRPRWRTWPRFRRRAPSTSNAHQWVAGVGIPPERQRERHRRVLLTSTRRSSMGPPNGTAIPAPSNRPRHGRTHGPSTTARPGRGGSDEAHRYGQPRGVRPDRGDDLDLHPRIDRPGHGGLGVEVLERGHQEPYAYSGRCRGRGADCLVRVSPITTRSR